MFYTVFYKINKAGAYECTEEAGSRYPRDKEDFCRIDLKGRSRRECRSLLAEYITELENDTKRAALTELIKN